MAKHFELSITETSLAYQRKTQAIEAEAALDGLYVIRTSLPAAQLDANATVAAHKSLAPVERAFRSIKTIDLNVRPVFHYSESRVRAHVLLCMLHDVTGDLDGVAGFKAHLAHHLPWQGDADRATDRAQFFGVHG